MTTQRKRAALVLASFTVLVLFCQSALGATASVEKSVTTMEDGKFLIKIKVRTTSTSLFGLSLMDPQSSIVNVYAPRGWCIVTDGGDFLARTSSDPVMVGKPIEFIIHSTSDKVNYTWSVFSSKKKLGEPETI